MQLLAKPPATFQQYIWMENGGDGTGEKRWLSLSES